jgi:hypothetical protein
MDPNWTTFWTPKSDLKYAVANSDAVGSGNTVNSSIESTVIDCGSFTNVKLKFLINYQHYSNPGLVQVRSAATGNVWTTVAAYSAVEAGSREINITSEAASESNVQIRFVYSETWGYYMLIDNVVVSGY